VTEPKRKRGRPPGTVRRYTPEILRQVWAGVETLRRIEPSLADVDKACSAFAARGFVEYHPEIGDKGVFWASAHPLPGAVGRVAAVLSRTGMKRKPQEDAAESFRKMYDRAAALRATDRAFRAGCDSLVRMNLLSRFHRDKIEAEDTSFTELAELMNNPSPAVLREIRARYPEPRKRRIGRRTPR
jgi:hypothetical protein